MSTRSAYPGTACSRKGRLAEGGGLPLAEGPHRGLEAAGGAPRRAPRRGCRRWSACSPRWTGQGDGASRVPPREAFGTVALSAQPDARWLANTLVHESMHATMCAVLDIVPLLEGADTQLYYALGGRTRPLSGSCRNLRLPRRDPFLGGGVHA